ncbi:MAG: hypothetical protein IJG33_14120 [Selenomonadaceae bacterium]|nr:hypothetical protein [Selenomonadaceae bacterium]
MRKIFFLTALLMMILTATAFAEETTEAKTPDEPSVSEEATEPEAEIPEGPYVYTSEDFKYSITCPFKPLAVVENPWQETDKHGEMLVFVSEGIDVLYGYIIQVDAFDTNEVPDFNKGSVMAIGEYLSGLKKNNGFGDARLVNINKKNKGVAAVTAEKIDVINPETGEVEGEFVADKQYIYTFFRTPEGRCISIQLISANLDDKMYVDTYRGSVASFKDNIKDKKSKKDKDKKSKKDKDKKDKKNKDKEKK